MRHFAKVEFTLLVLIVITGGVCQKAPVPAQPVAMPRSQATASSAVLPTLAGKDFYVAPAGSSTGDGSLGSPWDLATALGQPAAVQPGDHIWLRGGTYVGHFISSLNGTSIAPIIVRQYPGERATINGYDGTSSTQTTLAVDGSYAWFWGFEVMNSNTNRQTSGTGNTPPPGRGYGIDMFGPGTKAINLVVHDTSQGLGCWTGATGSEVYGNLIYYNGWDDVLTRGSGHGIYTQNDTPAKHLVDNIIFDGFAIGIHAYTEKGNIDNIDLEGNIAFANGGLSAVSGYTYNLLVGGLQVANKPSMVSNFTYTPPTADSNNNLGYRAGCTNATVTGNYFAGSSALRIVNCSNVTMTGNTFYGAVEGFSPSSFPNNTYLSQRPTETLVFVRPNKYEPGRANITVFNWASSAAVSVDLSELLHEGDEFVIRNVQDFFGPPVVSGTYSGGFVEIPMEGLAVVPPIGYPSPPSVSPDFGAFVVELLRPARPRPVRIAPSRSPVTVIPRRP